MEKKQLKDQIQESKSALLYFYKNSCSSIPIPEILANSFSHLYKYKMTTSSGGNISMKDNEESIWISPSAMDKGFLNAADIVSVDEDGSCQGSQKVSMETPFHLALYKMYPEIKAICHIHPVNLVALSLVQEADLEAILEKYNLAYAKYAMPGTQQLGNYITDAFRNKPRAVLMQNHGIIAIGCHINDLVNDLIVLNNEIGKYFNLKTVGIEGMQIEKEESISFYSKRVKHYLRTNGAFQFIAESSCLEFQLKINLSSLAELESLKIDFNSLIIPESYIILKGWIHKEQQYDSVLEKEYCSELSENSPILIFKNGNVIIGGHSYYQIYDRLEVLDFTANVLLRSVKMGKMNLLNQSQIDELRTIFF